MRIARSTPLVLALLLCGCDSGARGRPVETSVAPSASATANGTVLLRLEKIEGFLVEGFELQVRLQAPPDQLVLSSTWDELVHERHPQPTKTDFYGSLIRTTVPPGPFVLTTVMDLGMEPEQEPCVSRGEVKPGATMTVTVRFQSQGGCSTVSGGGS